MARPKKVTTDDMLKIIDAYYESHGDASKLKYSLLAQYAASVGIYAKEYDFRRDDAVRERVKELQASATIGTHGEAKPLAYKNLDVDAFINRNLTRETLRSALTELDDYWRGVYDNAATLSAKCAALSREALAHSEAARNLKGENAVVTSELQANNRRINELSAENRYLRKMLKTHLYPAIANEILYEEGVLKQTDTEVTLTAMKELVDPAAPVPFSKAIAADTRAISREAAILKAMFHNIYAGDTDA